MKKIISFFLLIAILFCTAYAENDNGITFLEIPWLSDDTSALQMLADKGYIHPGSSGINMENCYYLITDSEGTIEQIENGEYKEYCRSISFKESVMGKIAGYPVENIILSFIYDGGYQLVYAEVELLGSTYADIKQKLEKVYNSGEEFGTALGYQVTVWKGIDNSCVLLYTYDDGITFNLYYGRTDTTDIFAKCMEPADPDDVSGL